MKNRLLPAQDYYVIVDCHSTPGKYLPDVEDVYMRVLEFSRNKTDIINKLENVLRVMGKLGALRWAAQTGLPYITIANPNALQHYIGVIGADQFREAVRNGYYIKLGVHSEW